MSRPATDYTRCPRCRHRTVLFHFGKSGEDFYRCHYRVRFSGACGWETYVEPEGWDRAGRADLDAWRALNPDTALLINILKD